MRKHLVKFMKGILAKEKRNPMESGIVSAYYLLSGAYRRADDFLAGIKGRRASRLYLSARSAKRRIFGGKIGGKYNFITLDELVLWASEWIKKLPDSYDLVVGVPRSGLLVAGVIALKLGRPLTTPDLFAEGRTWDSQLIGDARGIKKVLLVDDSIRSGRTMREQLEKVRSAKEGIDVTTAALIATDETKGMVDLHCKIVTLPRLFEWNLLHYKQGRLFSDLDGVICENCPGGVDIDEKAYVEWIKNARPYLIPAFEIDAIISSRLEKYRPETERWLASHGVKYGRLVMWDLADKGERKGAHAQFKADQLLRNKPDMFWESSLPESEHIWKKTKIPTVCFDEMYLFS